MLDNMQGSVQFVIRMPANSGKATVANDRLNVTICSMDSTVKLLCIGHPGLCFQDHSMFELLTSPDS
jgi:hypothetical protein